jgi:hypothetical protein
VSVTSLDAKGANSVWSDYNSYKDISAPGESVYSTYSTNGSSKHNRYMYMSGTSAAAPVVSSAFALLWARVPGLTVSQAVSAITKTATPVTGNDHGAKTGSAGCVDAAAAVVKAAKLKPLAGASVKVSNATYTGKSLKPKVTVKLKGKKLVKGTDYLVVYRNNKRIGKGTAIVKGKGTYAGNIVKKFTIKVPAKVKKVKKSKGKKLKLRAKSGLWAKVSYGKVKYATGYQIAFKRSSAKKWNKAKIKGRKAELVGLASGKTYKVKVRPYIKCCGKYYYGKWSATKKVKARRW